MKVSFVVIGLNESYILPRCFESIAKLVEQTNKQLSFEFIYVDSGSTDNSINIAKRHGFQTYLLTGNKSASGARCVGAENATGDWILFLDGDMEINDDFINKALFSNHPIDENIIGYTGKRKEIIISENQEKVESEDYYGKKGIGVLRHLGGAVLLRKSCFDERSNYDPEQVMWEESLLLFGLVSKGNDIIG
ncbi:glycosyltransferase family 2 protein, partial [Vibrio owensii]|uniref:glycosyltransferase family 2 protein n=1 Tax=Vibrio owensii TaxID=696485 RepID=UPI003AAEB93D